MTTIINKYIGISHPMEEQVTDDKDREIIYEAWKNANCPQGIHLWDECWSTNAGDGEVEHYLHCDACGMEVHIEKIVIPDGKDDILCHK